MSTTNPLVRLQACGQSVWYDNIRRGLMTSGSLQRLLDEDGVVGVTSNPTIFDRAIGSSTDYDAQCAQLVQRGCTAEAIHEALVAQDIRMAADLLRPIFHRSRGADGYVSIEVNPHLAHDTAGTIAEARRLWRLIRRPNIMVKVPATAEGVPAVEHLIADGLNINSTLIFALERYEQIINAYLTGLERRVHARRPIRGIASVASFFVSRVDTVVDQQVDTRLAVAKDPREQAALRALLGRTAIANAKLAYQIFKDAFSRPRFLELQRRGARLQRPLWASTSTKNPAYRDVLYLEELIGPDTVNTMPPAALEAFRDHGRVRATLEEDVAGARRVLSEVTRAGIHLAQVTQQLEREGVEAFQRSHEQLLQTIRAKREVLQAGFLQRQSAHVGRETELVQATLAALDQQEFGRRLWAKDATLWKADAAHQHVIKNRLGWLTVMQTMRSRVGEMQAFAEEVRRAGFTHVVLLGMGGSSLCPEVLRATFGAQAGSPSLHVLDSTDPGCVRAVERAIHLASTLFIVSSKSGGTIEVVSFYRYFAERVRVARKGHAHGDHFIAITDPGTSLEKLARQDGFRRVFTNPPDVGGRFSALSYFGLVPAALMGLDVAALLERAQQMAHACGPGVPASQNPGLWLGAVLGTLAKHRRDKVTFVVDRRLQRFGVWVEQLIAESTGKEGKGIVPVEGEVLGPPASYGSDRLFIRLQVGRRRTALAAPERHLQALERAGYPVVRLALRDPLDLGAEFVRWEIATVVASAVLGINPFDEPNVKESKDNTAHILEAIQAGGRLPHGVPVLEVPGLRLAADAQTARLIAGAGRSLAEALEAHLRQVKAGDYVAMVAYVEPTPWRERLLQAVRQRWQRGFRVAVTLGYGPRYLHSTGQLHKGGPANGLFVQLVGEDAEDLSIPAAAYSFGTLKQAQALGDFQSLQAKQRRVVRILLGPDVETGLRALVRAALLERPLRQQRAKVET